MAVDSVETKSLVHFNDANGSQTFTDESGKTWTASGNAQISTAQYKFGDASGYFDGNGDYVTGSQSDDYKIGTGDGGVDFWIRPVNVSGIKVLFDLRNDGDSTNSGCWWLFLIDNKVRFGRGTSTIFTGSISLSANVWTHVAYVRYSGTSKVFINGVLDTSIADTTNYNGTGTRPRIGSGGDTYSYSPYYGYMDELRFSKGIATWTSNFTPPTNEYYPKQGGGISFMSQGFGML